MEKITITFDSEKIKDEFMGWLSDGGGEDSFNLVENVGYFRFPSDGSADMHVYKPHE